MSKRYVIQVMVDEIEWQNLQHPKGGDWLTHSRATAIADAAKLVNAGETRELRVAISRPVYAVTPDVNFAAIKAAAEVLAPDEPVFETDPDAHEAEDGGACCFQHRQAWLASQM